MPDTQKAKPDETVQQTSVDRYEQSPATVQFRRWTAHGGTAYLRGQQAGFSLAEAETLRRSGHVDIIHTRDVASRMVTK